MSRPARLVVVSGTGTEVGKTWVAAELARSLRAGGTTVAARKPAQSFDAGSGPTDADVLADATAARASEVCPVHRWYEVPMAPPMAAEQLGRPSFTIGDLVGELDWPDGVGVGLVEGAGGPRSPLASDGGDTVTLVAALAPELVLLVGDAALGAINAVTLAAAAFEGIAPVCTVLNRYDDRDDLHVRNRQWLVERAHCDVVVDVEELASRLLTD